MFSAEKGAEKNDVSIIDRGTDISMANNED